MSSTPSTTTSVNCTNTVSSIGVGQQAPVGSASRYTFILTQPSSGAAATLGTVPWKWTNATGGTPGVLSSSNNDINIVEVYTTDGYHYYGYVAP